MLSTGAFPSSGAATTLQLLSPRNAIGTNNSQVIRLSQSLNRPISIGSLVSIPGAHPWSMDYPHGVIPLLIRTRPLPKIGGYPIDGGLVDGPVYGSIFNNLIGIKLYNVDTYADFQSNLAVYHDDYGDYSTNEPTMDGTASLIYLLAAKEAEAAANSKKKPLKD